VPGTAAATAPKELKRIHYRFQHGVGKIAGRFLDGFVAAQQVAAIGRHMQVDQRPESQFAIIVCPSLEGEEGVDVDGSKAEALLCRVVGIDE